MADTKVSAMTNAATLGATDKFHIVQGGNDRAATTTQMAAFVATLITGATGTVASKAAPSETLHVLTSNPGDVTGTSLVTQMTAQTVDVGWWQAEYWVHWQSDVTTTGINMVVEHSGTATPFVAHRIDPIGSQTALATVGIAHQTADEGVTGNLSSTWAANANAGALGPNAGVTTADSAEFSLVRALFLVTASGDLLFRIAAEIAATAVRLQAGTCARYTRLS